MSLVESLEANRLIAHVREIARWVRLSGSDEESKAFDYIEGQLRASGVTTERLRHQAFISHPKAAGLRLDDGTSIDCVTHSFVPSTAPDGITGELVDVNEIPESTEMMGMVALVDGLAMTADVVDLERRGAVAQIFVNADVTYEMIPSSAWGSPGPDDDHRYPRTPVVSVTRTSGDELRRRLRQGATRATVTTEVASGWRDIPLLVADVVSPRSDDFVLLSGHVDGWHHGAMDNATGNAVMIEIARGLVERAADMQRGVRLCFWSGHSHGRYAGSAWYADHHWHDLREHCVVHVNIDSVGGEGATVLSGGISMASTFATAAASIRDETGSDYHGSRVGRAGDQSFVALGIPSLWMTLSEQEPSDGITSRVMGHLVGGRAASGGLGWWWHTTEDTLDHVSEGNLLRDGRIYARAIERLTMEATPLDIHAEAAELVVRLTDLAEAARGQFDLSEVTMLASDIEGRLAPMQASPPSAGTPQAELLRGVLRELICLNYSAAGPYDQDPAEPVPPLPLLGDARRLATMSEADDRHRLLTRLVRRRNQVTDRLRQIQTKLGQSPATVE